ncbi:XdhC family protein [Umezawaea endophytica]|uniref:XdhC family protein n=1 Tax=Umezawaea endophytica TaxID=1654476 RepID=A0A9X3A0F5_9PSEU|nr:XdhC family protein [Umezawaea endophytica]MCS7478514.1 XdhC family protein [Umezawaea endophytica]
MSVLTRVDDLRSGRTPFVLATVVRAERPTSARPGDRAVVLPDGSVEGFVGGTCAESTVRTLCLRLLATGESTLLRITPTADSETVAEGVVTVGNPCLSGGSLDIFLETVLPPVLVHVHGDGPVARALVDVGRAIGHDVREASPTPPHDLAVLVVASHGRDEEPLLTAALRAEVPYVGLIASRRRGQAVLAALPVTDAQRARVHTPAGLDIGARTPAEVALSVYAQVIAEHVRAHEPAPPRTAVDPVCGMAVTIDESTASVVDDGTTRYFCGPGCRRTYTDDPKRHRA